MITYMASRHHLSKVQNQILEDIGASYCQGLTLLGGEPMLNTNVLLPLCQALRDHYGHSKDIWCWSGYTFEELLVDSEDKLALLDLINSVVEILYNPVVAAWTSKETTTDVNGTTNTFTIHKVISFVVSDFSSRPIFC